MPDDHDPKPCRPCSNRRLRRAVLASTIVSKSAYGLEPGERMLWFLMQEQANHMFHGSPPDDVVDDVPDHY